jgi:hypothetical protein
LQKRQILGNDDQAKREHPHAEDGQEGKYAREDKQCRHKNPRDPARRPSQPNEELAQPGRKMLLDPLKIAIKLRLRCTDQSSLLECLTGNLSVVRREAAGPAAAPWPNGRWLPATASDTNAYSRSLDAEPRTAVIVMMTSASIVSVILIVSVTFALDHHPPLAALTPATAVLVAHHAHVLHAAVDACCHRGKGRGVCAANE